MSAWYALSAMGFYSFCPGRPVYEIGRPIFDKVYEEYGLLKPVSCEVHRHNYKGMEYDGLVHCHVHTAQSSR